MERYHDTSNDPAPLFSPAHELERALIAELTQAYLDSGASIEQVGFRMSNRPATYVVNAKRALQHARRFTSPKTLH